MDSNMINLAVAGLKERTNFLQMQSVLMSLKTGEWKSGSWDFHLGKNVVPVELFQLRFF